MSDKLYANNRCIMEVEENPGEEIAKKPCNCPNCGAPISSYICEYCGTKLDEDPFAEQIQTKKDEISKLQNDLLLSTLNASQMQQTQVMHMFLMNGVMSPLQARQASQADIWRMQQANIYASTQTMFSDQTANIQANIYPASNAIAQDIPEQMKKASKEEKVTLFQRIKKVISNLC